MVWNKLNRFIYEIDYNKKFNLGALSFDEIVEMLVSANESERQEIYECLDGEMQEKIDALIEGGIL
jgi:hypothetical protein